jgi:hypothetical protein
MTNDDESSKAIDELNGATVQGRAIVVNKSEPNQKEKEEVLTITVVEISRWLWWWKQPWWRKPWWWKQRRILISILQ